MYTVCNKNANKKLEHNFASKITEIFSSKVKMLIKKHIQNVTLGHKVINLGLWLFRGSPEFLKIIVFFKGLISLARIQY